MGFLVDTDVCSAHLKGVGVVTNRFFQYGGQLHVSTITVGELYTWALRAKAPPRRRSMLRELLDEVRVLDVNLEVAQKFGELRAALFDTGQPAPDMDLMIAATALARGLTLVTHNVQDFRNVKGLAIEDWLS